VGAHLGARRRDVHGEDRRVIRKAVAAVLRLAWKVVAIILVTLLLLFVVGWLVDVIVDPAEQEITTVEG
jgi:putative effector of murein hydrolase LrgA (UPF0299 family)